MTKERILDAGVDLWPDITLKAVADAADLKHTAVLYYFPTVSALKTAVARHAVEKGNSRVIVQLLAQKHPSVKDMPPAQRIHHFNSI